MQDHGRMLSVEQTAEVLGTTPRFVRRLIAERRIAFVRYGSPGAPVRIAESDVRRFLTAGRVEAMSRASARASRGWRDGRGAAEVRPGAEAAVWKVAGALPRTGRGRPPGTRDLRPEVQCGALAVADGGAAGRPHVA
jgi:excisionase family DNA binding protein